MHTISYKNFNEAFKVTVQYERMQRLWKVTCLENVVTTPLDTCDG